MSSTRSSPNKGPLTPSASPAPPQVRRRKRSVAPPQPTQDEIHQKRQDSTNKLLATWSSLALKWSKPLDEDDIVDLSTEKIIQDRGVLRGSKALEIGYSTTDASEDETELEEDLDAEEEVSEQDELDLIMKQNSRANENQAEADPADEEELKQFLEAEERWRQQYGAEVEVEETITTSGTSDDGASNSGEETSDDELGRWDNVEEMTPVAPPSSSPPRPRSPIQTERVSRKPPRVPPLQLNTPPLSSASSVSLPSSPLPATDELYDQAGDWLAGRTPSRAEALAKEPNTVKATKKTGSKLKDATSPSGVGTPTTKKSTTKAPVREVSRRVTDLQTQSPKATKAKSAGKHAAEAPPSPTETDASTATARRSPRRAKSQAPPSTPAAASMRARSPSPDLPSPPSARTLRRTAARKQNRSESAEEPDREESEDPLNLSLSTRPDRAGQSTRTPKVGSLSQQTKGSNLTRSRSPSPCLPPRPPPPMRSGTVPASRSMNLRSSISPPSSPVHSPQKRKRRSSLSELPPPPPSFSRASTVFRETSKAPGPSSSGARDKGKGKARAASDEDLGIGSSRNAPLRHSHEAQLDRTPQMRHGSMAPNYMTPFQDPRAHSIIYQAIYDITSLAFPSPSGPNDASQQPPPNPFPHFPGYPPPQFHEGMHWNPSYPSTPHRKKRRQGSRENTYGGWDTSSSPAIPGPSSGFQTPHHAHPSAYDPAYSRGTLPPSSPVPSHSSDEEDEEEETESKPRNAPVTPSHSKSKARDTLQQQHNTANANLPSARGNRHLAQDKSPSGTNRNSRGRQLHRKVSFAEGSRVEAHRRESSSRPPSSREQGEDEGSGSDSDEVEIVEHIVVKQEGTVRRPLAPTREKRGVTPAPQGQPRPRGRPRKGAR